MLEWWGTEQELKKCGVYGIFDGDTLVYIGSTKLPFKKRYQTHDRNFRQHSTEQKLYSYKPKKTLCMYPLFCVENLKCSNRTKYQIKENIEWMEWGAMLVTRPLMNKAGLTCPFKFNKGAPIGKPSAF